MGKTTYKASAGLVEQLMLAMNPYAAQIPDPTRDFLTVGTPKDVRNDTKFEVSANELK